MGWRSRIRTADGLCGAMKAPGRRSRRKAASSRLTTGATRRNDAGSSRPDAAFDHEPRSRVKKTASSPLPSPPEEEREQRIQRKFSGARRIQGRGSFLPIRAVTFDVGGTLIEVWPCVGHVYAEVAARNGIKGLSPTSLNRRFAAAWRAAKRFGYSRSDWAALVDATFLGLTERPPSRTFFAELYDHFSTPGAWHIFDDVIPALQTLAGRGLKLGVVSNWDERLRPLLEHLRLARYFETIVVSGEVGTAKPAAAIFQHAIQRLQLPPEAVLHVGDDLSMDVRGARAAGLRALRLQRGDGPRRPGCIASLRELWEAPGRAAALASARWPVSDNSDKSQ
jgi:putative hydrolase of the HAD superfamily